MALEKITQIKGTAVPVPGDDIDTDRIIPARYMKVVTFDDLGDKMFYDVRFNEDGSKKAHPLNEEKYSGATLLISGFNFGCGSSREHAPQAIARAGFKAVIAGNFAEIFFGNATTLGMPCVSLEADALKKLTTLVQETPSTEITIDLTTLTLTAGSESFPFTIRESAHDALIHGRWDAIGELIEGLPEVEKTAATLPYMAQA